MRNIYIIILITLTKLVYSTDFYWAANSGNNWSTVLNWTDAGGIPLGSTPGNTDIVHFTGSDNSNCNVDIDVNIGGLIVDGYTGTIDINGNSFQVSSGDCIFNTGTITGGTLTINTTGTITFAGTIFGAIVDSKSDRVHLNGSTFNAVATIEKKGAGNDNNTGGNTFLANTTITNSGSGYLRLENGNADTFAADLTLVNSGSSYLIFATNSAGNIISGNLTAINSGNGNTYLQISYNAVSTVSISGNVTLDNTGSGSLTRSYLCVRGTVNVGGNLTLNNSATATTARMYLAYYDNAQINVSGNTTISNNGNATNDQIYAGNQGDITYNGTVTITNNSSANNSRIYCNIGANSNVSYNENIIIESTNANCDGISFGESGGTGTLAATKTITIGSNGFIAGDLLFRNFTQVGNTSQSLTCTGTARIYNYDSNWGGDVTFIAPRIRTRETIYNGTTYLEKTGTTDDYSEGGNDFKQDVELKNSGTRSFIMGNGNPDTCRANLTINNTNSYNIYFAHYSTGNYIAGNLIANNTVTSNGHIYFNYHSNSTLTIDGTTTLNNNPTADNAQILFGYNGTTTCNGNVSVSNNGGGTYKRIYLGSNGDIIFNGDIYIANNSNATNSEIFCNYGSNSSNTYNENITVESTIANCDGVRFGQNGGTGTLVATKTITIGSGGFIAGDLQFRNFTQVGNTPQALTCTGTARIYNYDSNWGGNVSFVAPRILTRGTIYNGTAYIEKTGTGDDVSVGGNDFKQDVELKNSGTRSFIMGNGNPDTCRANLTINNTNSYNIYFAHRSAGNYIAGNLIANNTVTSNGHIYFNYYSNSTLTIDGTTTLNNNPTADNAQILFGYNGTTICNDNVNVSNNGGGTYKRIYLGNSGDITFNGKLNITNNSDAAYSEIFCNYSSNSSNAYNENITVESTDANCDGIRFGQNGGTGTLAATKTITIGSNGFIAGDLQFRNFTQVGNTPQALTCTGTARIYNYDSNWGGNVSFVAPRILTRGTIYNGTAYIEKTGAGNDRSAGGNNFKMNAELKNSGNGYFLMGRSEADTCRANLTINNEGSSNMYFAYNSTNNYIAGNLIVNNTTSSGNSTYISFTDYSSSSLTIDGTVLLNNNSTATTGYIRFGNYGTTICNGDVTVSNNGGGTTKQIYLGNSGDITFNGNLYISNNSNATNSQIHCNYRTSSTNTYNENIIVESTDSNCDGILFGGNGGTGTLAATKTITIGSNGFIAGYLYFRNFTQIGNTSQILHPTGTTTIYNYNSNWGGDVNFVSPRIVTKGTTYNGLAYLEKTGSGDDYSAGGNDFKQNVELRNSGTRSFIMGNGNPDTCRANLLVNNTGSRHLYFAHHSTGNYIGGDITINNVASSGTAYIFLATDSISTLNIDGNCTINNNSSSTTCRTYLGYRGDVTIEGNLDVVNQGTNRNSIVTLGNNKVSLITINGNTTLTNNGNNNTKQIIAGYNGDIIFNGTLDISNNSDATNSQIYLNFDDNSNNIYNENIIVECTNSGCDGILFGNSNGTGTLAANKTITIGSNGFIAGDLQFRNFTQVGNTPQNLTCTGTARIYNYDSNWGGNVNFVSPRILTIGTTYNGTAYLEKTGAGNNYSRGGNVFQANATIKNSGTGRFYMGSSVPDDYNADVTYIKTNSGGIYPAYNAASTYAGNMYFDSNSQISLGGYSSNGKIVFDGTTPQSINNLGSSQTFVFRRLQTNNTNNEITLNTPIEVSVELDLDNGNIITTSTNLLYMRDNSTVSSVSDDAYVRGPIEKIGNDAFTFPVGDSSMYRPISISAPTNSWARFRAEYIKENPWNHWSGGSGSRDATIDHISSKEYWYLNRIASSNNVNVTLSWRNPESGGVTNLNDIIVARWNGSKWKDHGNGGTTGDVNNGTVITSAPVTSFSPFTLASRTTENPLPVEFTFFNAKLNGSQVDLSWQTYSEVNNDYFTVERSSDGIYFEEIGTVNGAGNSNNINNYYFPDKSPLKGLSYYRLKQTDYDGSYKYSDIKAVNINQDVNNLNITLYPNPVKNNNLNIYFSKNIDNLNISIYDIYGKEIMNKKYINIKNINIPTKSLEKGMYFINFIIEDKKYTNKIIVE